MAHCIYGAKESACIRLLLKEKDEGWVCVSAGEVQAIVLSADNNGADTIQKQNRGIAKLNQKFH
jgi:hypothetical protein